MAGSNFSILVDVELQTNTIRQQLQAATKGIKLDLKSTDASKGLKDIESSAKNTKNAVDELNDSGQAVGLTFQEANLIFSRSVEAISSMVDQVYQMNSALIEFRKVSDLSGESLDKYVTQLQEMGSTVARTGKPKCLSRGVGMVNQHQELFKIQ